jgi:hypothetical protein
VSCAVKFPTVVFPPIDMSVATKAVRPSLDRRGPVRSEPSSADQTRPSVVQRTRRASDIATTREAADDINDRRVCRSDTTHARVPRVHAFENQ